MSICYHHHHHHSYHLWLLSSSPSHIFMSSMILDIFNNIDSLLIVLKIIRIIVLAIALLFCINSVFYTSHIGSCLWAGSSSCCWVTEAGARNVSGIGVFSNLPFLFLFAIVSYSGVDQVKHLPSCWLINNQICSNLEAWSKLCNMVSTEPIRNYFKCFISNSFRNSGWRHFVVDNGEKVFDKLCNVKTK